MNKFDIYARVRATRQAAGDKHIELLTAANWVSNEETNKWEEVESLMLRAECILETVNLKD